VADQLAAVARILREQGANPFRVGAYENAAKVLRAWSRPLAEVLATEGLLGLDAIPGIGPGLARAIEAILTTGHLPFLDRLREHSDPVALLMSVPGVGARLAERLHQSLGIDTLEGLEQAAHDGRLAEFRESARSAWPRSATRSPPVYAAVSRLRKRRRPRRSRRFST
jgi:DNA polymerase/3'-5' exonuclease PolX